MKLNSIRTKVLAALIVCLAIGVSGIIALMQYNFSRNASALAAESVTEAQRLFDILEAREISKMSVVAEMLAANDRCGTPSPPGAGNICSR